MPEIRDVTVHITSGEGVELPEWGVHNFRRNHKASAYVQSKTDMPFRVSITPKMPYVAADLASAHVYKTRRRGSDKLGSFQMEDEWEDVDGGGTHYRPDDEHQSRHSSKRGASRTHRRSLSAYRSTDRRIKREPNDISTSFSRLAPSRNFRQIPPPPFHFLACLYLDGRSKAERKLVVYLDPDDEDFNRPDGKVSFKSRWVQGKDGELREHGWVFKDVGIETVFDKMLLSGDHDVSGKVHMRDEDSIIAAMDAADLGEEGDVEREERTKVGQIVVTIERIKLGRKWVDSRFRAKHKEGDLDDVQMDGANTEITHTAGVGQAAALLPKAVRVVSYTPYYAGEGVYATFQFFYRSEEMLRKFNFPGFQQSQSVYRNYRYLNAKLANLTPLGIGQPLRPKNNSSKQIITPFEKRLKKDVSAVKVEPSEYHFSDGYRENDENIRKEESVCEFDDTDPSRSPAHRTSKPDSHSPPTVDGEGNKKESQQPEGNDNLSDSGHDDLDGTPLGNKYVITPSQTSKNAAFIISRPSDTALPPSDYELGSYFEGPDVSLLGARAVSSLSLPSTASPPSTKSSEHRKPSHKPYRKLLFESDADDEGSDKETRHGSDEETIDDCEQSRHEDVENVAEIQSAMDKIQLGKRSRDGDDDAGRTGIDRSQLGLRSASPTEQLILETRDSLEIKRERDMAKKIEVQSQSTKDEENAGPAKRRKGSEGQLVDMVGTLLDAGTDEG